MSNRSYFTITFFAAALFSIAASGQEKTKISPNGTLLPPGKTEAAAKEKPKTKLKLKNNRKATGKAKSKTAAKPKPSKIKLSGQAAARSSSASSVLTRLPGNPDQIKQAAKDQVKEINKDKAEAKGKQKLAKKPTKKTVGKTTKLKNAGRLASGATKTHPNNGPRRPSAYADKSGTRKPAAKALTKSKLNTKGASKLAGGATRMRPGNPPRRPSAYADKTPVRKPVAKSLAAGGQKTKIKSPSKAQHRPKAIARSSKPTPKSGGAKLGKAAGGVAAAGLAIGAAGNFKDAKTLRDQGKISKSQYNKMQATNSAKVAGGVLALKKLNVSGAVMNDVIGTDPISLGVDAVGDLINGTDNAKQSVKNMKKAWNKSLTKQVFTDPEAAGKRVASDVKEAGKKIGDATKKVGQETKKAAKKVGSAVKKAGKKVKKAADKAKNFVGGIFKKKK